MRKIKRKLGIKGMTMVSLALSLVLSSCTLECRLGQSVKDPMTLISYSVCADGLMAGQLQH